MFDLEQMGLRQTDALERVLRVLGDGDKHRRQEVIQASAVEVVAPTVASLLYELERFGAVQILKGGWVRMTVLGRQWTDAAVGRGTVD